MMFSKEGKRRVQGGFTLVEVLVSAVILGIALAGVIAMLQKGTELDVNGDHRRQARAIIHAAFERPEFHFSRYKLIDPNSWVETVQLDSGDVNAINATLAISVSPERTMNGGGETLPYKEINIRLAWQELEGLDTVSISKRLAEPR